MSSQATGVSSSELSESNKGLSEESVQKVIEFAKLDLKNLKSDVQRMSFASCLDDNQIKLLELDSTAAEELENGGKLYIRGNAADSCVMCTKDKTYEIKGAEISNSLLLVPRLQLPQELSSEETNLSIRCKEVKAVMHHYLEMKNIKPKVKVLGDLLKHSVYDGPEHEDKITHKLTFRDLLLSVQASETELHKTLNELEVCELDGFIRIIDFDYLTRVLNSIISLLEENSWQLDDFDKQECIMVLETLYAQPILEHVLNCYGSSHPTIAGRWMLNEDKVCRFFAELLLRFTEKFNLDEFLEAWKQSVPEGMITSLQQIQGMAFIDTSSNPSVIRYFKETSLSEDVNERFTRLFEAKEQWTSEEITPYVQPLCVGKMTVGIVLTKYARSFSKNGQKLYKSKYVK